MSKKNRLYSLPYNCSNPNWFISEVIKRKKYIHHVFCEFPYNEPVSHLKYLFNGSNGQIENTAFSMDSYYNHIKLVIDFLKKSEGKFKRICTLNSACYFFKNATDLTTFCDNVIKNIIDYKIDGLIVSDYRIAEYIYKILPELELHTSCNTYSWNIRQMQIWKDNCGIKVFNPPRDILRKISSLKEMHDAGFSLKCIVNEGCLFGCPNTVTHPICIATHCYFGQNCIRNGYGDIFKSNWILPRWQKYYDAYVDIYKIAGRDIKVINYPFECLDAYIQEKNNLCLSDIMINGTMNFLKSKLDKPSLNKITLDKIPDKLVTCECKECGKCTLCEKSLDKILTKEQKMLFQ